MFTVSLFSIEPLVLDVVEAGLHEEDDELEEDEPRDLDLLLRLFAALREYREQGVGKDVTHELHLVWVRGVGEVTLAQLQEEGGDVHVTDLGGLVQLGKDGLFSNA